MIGLRIEYHDAGPDERGRRSFTLTWVDPDGIFREELAPDGGVVGYRRAQCFRCDPARFEAQVGVAPLPGRWTMDDEPMEIADLALHNAHDPELRNWWQEVRALAPGQSVYLHFSEVRREE